MASPSCHVLLTPLNKILMLEWYDLFVYTILVHVMKIFAYFFYKYR